VLRRVGDATAGDNGAGVLMLECWGCPRHADHECCAVLAMLLLLVVMVLECWRCPRHAERECCAVWRCFCWCRWCGRARAALVMLIVSAVPFGDATAGGDGAGVLALPSSC
jgi:hypothetical protein